MRLRWEEDLRRFRQAGNPALLLQARLGERLGAGLQPLALQLPLDDPARLPQAWNRCAAALRREGLPLPLWAESSLALRGTLGSETWVRRVLDLAAAEGLDPVALERPLQALRACAADPGALPRSLEALPGGLDQVILRDSYRGDRPNLRWVLVHLIEEYARHCGHADLLRESIDGQVGD